MFVLLLSPFYLPVQSQLHLCNLAYGNEILQSKPTEKEFVLVFFSLFLHFHSLVRLGLRFSLVRLVVFCSLDCILFGLLDTFGTIFPLALRTQAKAFPFSPILATASFSANSSPTPATSCARFVWLAFLQFPYCIWPKPRKYLSVLRKSPSTHFVAAAATRSIFSVCLYCLEVFTLHSSRSMWLHVRLYQRTTYGVLCAHICAVSTSFFVVAHFLCYARLHRKTNWQNDKKKFPKSRSCARAKQEKTIRFY